MAERILLMGGSFDPVHHGHLIVARAVAEATGAGRVFLIPAARPPHKAGPSVSGEHRLAMLREAVKGDPMFEVRDLELARAGPSYTYDTVTALVSSLGPDAKLLWLIGADMLEDLPTWSRAEQLLEIVQIVTAVRPPWDRRLDSVFSKLERELPARQIASLKEFVVRGPLVEISSSDIRSRVRSGRSIRYLTTDSVRTYIQKSRLYGSSGAGE